MNRYITDSVHISCEIASNQNVSKSKRALNMLIVSMSIFLFITL